VEGFVWGILAGITATMVADWALLVACRCKRCIARRDFLQRYDAQHPNPEA